MPKKKVHHKKTAHHKKSGGHMGALDLHKKEDQGMLQLAAGVVAGAVIKRVADNLIAKQASTTGVTIKQSTVNLVEGAGGAVLFYFMDQPFLRGMGVGLVGAVAYDMSQNLKLSGIGLGDDRSQVLVPFAVRPNLSGVTQTPSVAGATAYNFPKPAGVGRVRAHMSHMR